MEGIDFRWVETRPTNSTMTSVCGKKRLSDRKFGEQKSRVKRKKRKRITKKKRKRINSRRRKS
jgi:hypothetical protein